MADATPVRSAPQGERSARAAEPRRRRPSPIAHLISGCHRRRRRKEATLSASLVGSLRRRRPPRWLDPRGGVRQARPRPWFDPGGGGSQPRPPRWLVPGCGGRQPCLPCRLLPRETCLQLLPVGGEGRQQSYLQQGRPNPPSEHITRGTSPATTVPIGHRI